MSRPDPTSPARPGRGPAPRSGEGKPGAPRVTVEFERGTLLLDGPARIDASGLPGLAFDPRVRCWRAPARLYAGLLERLRAQGLEVDDRASEDAPLPVRSRLERRPFPHQTEALEAWLGRGGRGVVVLPTGAGKTFLAQLAIEETGRSALVVAPTLDLVSQWYGVLSTSFDTDVGIVGGGDHDVRPLTVATYDSAFLHAETLGNRFGLVVFDECHHLPGPSYRVAADACLAPRRLGLTATPEREDGRETLLDELVGPVVYRKDITDLAGRYLSDYETFRIRVRLSPEEEARYERARGVYLAFVRRHGIPMGSPGGWGRFLSLTSRSEEGRRAFLAYREQKRVAQGSEAKLRFLERALGSHRGDRVLVFTNDNETVYAISRRFLVPAITHQTKVKERHETLRRFNEGRWPVLATSKVLNEGVDVPEANVAVVLSGSGSVREHVQRLGRVLRPGRGKRAVLYEVVAGGTGEESTSTRRRRHRAYG